MIAGNSHCNRSIKSLSYWKQSRKSKMNLLLEENERLDSRDFLKQIDHQKEVQKSNIYMAGQCWKMEKKKKKKDPTIFSVCWNCFENYLDFSSLLFIWRQFCVTYYIVAISNGYCWFFFLTFIWWNREKIICFGLCRDKKRCLWMKVGGHWCWCWVQ